MVYKIEFGSNKPKKYIKKLKDRILKKKFSDLIFKDIAINPYSGKPKEGDLATIYTKKIWYQKTQYRIGYKIKDDNIIVIILLVGTRENFYEELKRLL
ncbi:type II toxin-antitoxin system RelE/ParE family toxin [Lactobacillus sp. PSON]|uniref:type II toxin-antitoxin system RelE/ParE family toxin n=1 Tax=Lactobacillus sp. PSON TaxID=3455454 RepID=UPI004041DD8D